MTHPAIRAFLHALAVAVAMVLATGPAWGATTLPEPHSSCLSEPDRVSAEGQVEAQLTVVNNTDAVFELYWLDYDGERVYYQDSLPHSSQIQDTWLTHPWILTDPQGTCYLLIVITSQVQTMTIGSTTGEIPVTPMETTTTSSTPETTQSTSASPTAVALEEPDEPEGGSGFPTPLVVGALAMMGVLVGVLFATGRLFRPKGKKGP